MYLTHIAAALANSSVRTLSQQEELPLLRDHLLRLDPAIRLGHRSTHSVLHDAIEGMRIAVEAGRKLFSAFLA